MRYQSSGSEALVAVARLVSGDTVTVAAYDLSDGLSVSLSSAATAEIGTTGYYRWLTSNLTAQPTSFTEMLVIFTSSDTGEEKATKLVFGGYTDDVDAATSTRATAASIAALNDLSQAEILSDATPFAGANVDATTSSRATAASIAALNDLSTADVQTAMTSQGYTTARATKLDNLDAAISSLNDLSSADVTAAVWGITEAALASAGAVGLLTALGLSQNTIIDFTGDDALGWQLVINNTAGAEIGRLDLYDEAFARIPAATSVSSFISGQKAISKAVPS